MLIQSLIEALIGVSNIQMLNEITRTINSENERGNALMKNVNDANKMNIENLKLGKWEGKPIEWCVLKEESFGTLVISKDRIAQMVFDNSSSNNNWGSCSLRKFLNGDFFNQAFSDDEKKKIVNVKNDYTKDDIFILTKDEVENLLKDDYYDTEYHGSCSYCCWTRTKDGTKVRTGYASGCWCSHVPNYKIHCVRPAMYIKMK